MRDKVTPIRKIWDIFVEKCMYGENSTVDEQLLEFRDPFRMYIPNKPTKYGIKIVLINDNDSKNLLGAIRPVRGLQQLSKLRSFSITKRSLITVYYCNIMFIAHTLTFVFIIKIRVIYCSVIRVKTLL